MSSIQISYPIASQPTKNVQNALFTTTPYIQTKCLSRMWVIVSALQNDSVAVAVAAGASVVFAVSLWFD